MSYRSKRQSQGLLFLPYVVCCVLLLVSRNLNIEARHGLVGICIDQQNASRCDAVVTGSDMKKGKRCDAVMTDYVPSLFMSRHLCRQAFLG